MNPNEANSHPKVFSKINPATLEKIGDIQEVDPSNIPNIVRQARASQQEWVQYSLQKRIKLLKRVSIYIADHLDEIAQIICQETGKPKLESLNNDIFSGLSALKFGLEQIKHIFKRQKINFGSLNPIMKLLGRSSYIYPRPIGVVGIISPWNYPFGIPFSQLILAVVAGNSVILKPSSETPLTGIKIQEIFDNSGLPKGLVQTIPGRGGTIGNALIDSSIDRIIFTGSVEIGKKIMERAAQRLTPITLELGGKDAFIVCNDADIERTTSAAVWGSFVNSGQTCVCAKRIYVQNEIYDKFIEQFKIKVENLKQGYGWDDPEVSVGSLINEKAVHDMELYVSHAIEQGAKILTGGERNTNLKGFFFRPTIIVHATQSMDVVRQEIFGPVVVVLPFTTDDEVVVLANDSPFALSGSVWTQNIKRGIKIANQISSGTVLVNNIAYTFGLTATPWGGKGDSGFGRTHGQFGFHELLEPHHIHVDKAKFPKEFWWQPYDKAKLEVNEMIFDVLYKSKLTKALKLLGNVLRIVRDKNKNSNG